MIGELERAYNAAQNRTRNLQRKSFIVSVPHTWCIIRSAAISCREIGSSCWDNVFVQSRPVFDPYEYLIIHFMNEFSCESWTLNFPSSTNHVRRGFSFLSTCRRKHLLLGVTSYRWNRRETEHKFSRRFCYCLTSPRVWNTSRICTEWQLKSLIALSPWLNTKN